MARIYTFGLRLCQSVRDWNSRPAASRVFSPNGTPTSCRATGRLPAKPHGSTSAGSPARFPALDDSGESGGVPAGGVKPARRDLSALGGRTGPSRREQDIDLAEEPGKSLLDQSAEPHRLEVVLGRDVSRLALSPAICGLSASSSTLPLVMRGSKIEPISAFRIVESVGP